MKKTNQIILCSCGREAEFEEEFCGDCIIQDALAMGELTQEELDEAIKDAEFCEMSVYEAIKMNRYFKADTEYFEENFVDYY